jgi:hypothetical protein
MATKNSRLNVVLEPALMQDVNDLAKSQGVSLSAMARDLIKEALCAYEDSQWQNIVQERERKFSYKKSIKKIEWTH